MKHAYMIMAHNQPELLKILLQSLDIEENDIILHLDQRSALNYADFGQVVKHAQLFTVPRMKCTWGGYSQIATEMELLHKAVTIGNHSYYHLVSGTDLPLKPIVEINRFYESSGEKDLLILMIRQGLINSTRQELNIFIIFVINAEETRTYIRF